MPSGRVVVDDEDAGQDDRDEESDGNACRSGFLVRKDGQSTRRSAVEARSLGVLGERHRAGRGEGSGGGGGGPEGDGGGFGVLRDGDGEGGSDLERGLEVEQRLLRLGESVQRAKETDERRSDEKRNDEDHLSDDVRAGLRVAERGAR